MAPNDIPTALASHAFEHLFLEDLGWDRLRTEVIVEHDGQSFPLTGVAHKRGFAVFTAPAHRTVLANRRMLRDIQKQLRKTYHEHILIHFSDTPRKQVWQWATLDGRRRIQHREHPFFSDAPPPRLLERIRGLSVSFAEEEQTTLTDVLDRVRAALKPDAEQNLFAKWPKYAAMSDQLAMAHKNGEPGALQRLVEHHMRLARKSSKMLIRWFGMEPEDAEQTAMIGLVQAASRFDPDRGFQFSTYAGYWIRQACQKYGIKWGLSIHVPMHYFWECYKLTYVEMELIATYGVSVAREHFDRTRENAGVTLDQWENFIVARSVCRFSELDHKHRCRLDKPCLAPANNHDNDLFHNKIHRAINSIHPRLGLILKKRYGIDQPEHSLQEVAVELGITKERVRQLQVAAEAKLVRFIRSNYSLDEFDIVEELTPDEPPIELLELQL